MTLWQRVLGHKIASDDLLLAGLAALASPNARHLLDLGTGKGTVALLLAGILPEARIVGVEAFAQSMDLARRNVSDNGLEARVELRLGDLRDDLLFSGDEPFDLITGAPPFMPLGSGPMPRDGQRAAGRFELRGGIEAYAARARGLLGDDGRFVFLMDGGGRVRAEHAMRQAGLGLEQVITISPRPVRPPTYVVLVGQRTQPGRSAGTEETVLTMREAEGEGWSPGYLKLRRALDLPWL